jgi:predicted tellurium resistance membrane protein TerC
MSARAVSNWLSSTALSQVIQTTHGAIAGIQMIHIVCLATLVALALNLSLRLAGRGLAAEPLSSLAARFVSAMWLCLGLLLLTGALLIIAEPHRTLTNPAFYAKMTLLAVAVVFTLRFAALARRQPDKPTTWRIAAATLYMLLWLGIVVAGRYIAYRI